MPYIMQSRRDELAAAGLETLVNEVAFPGTKPGDIAYIVARLTLAFVKSHGETFSAFAAAFGAITLTLDEIYTRLVKPYEGDRRKDNGDVFTVDVRA